MLTPVCNINLSCELMLDEEEGMRGIMQVTMCKHGLVVRAQHTSLDF